MIPVTSKWADQPAFGISLTTETPGLHISKTSQEGEVKAVTATSLTVAPAEFSFTPAVNGMIMATYTSANLKLGDDVYGTPPKVFVVSTLEPEELLHWDRVESLVSAFLTLVATEHWSKREE